MTKTEIAQLEEAFVERYEKAMALSDKLYEDSNPVAHKLLSASITRKLEKLTREKDEIRERLMVLYRERLDGK